MRCSAEGGGRGDLVVVLVSFSVWGFVVGFSLGAFVLFLFGAGRGILNASVNVYIQY